jgi:hypothetical protein
MVRAATLGSTRVCRATGEVPLIVAGRIGFVLSFRIPATARLCPMIRAAAAPGSARVFGAIGEVRPIRVSEVIRRFRLR